MKELTKGRTPVLRPSSRKLPNLESSSRTHQYVSPKWRESLENVLYVRTQIQKLGLHVPTCSRHVARVTAFLQGKCREMSKTPTSRDCRQMSKRMSRHVYLGQVLTGRDLVEDAKGMGRALRGAAPQMGTVACLGISRGSWPTVGLKIAYTWPTTGRRRRGRSRTVGVLV